MVDERADNHEPWCGARSGGWIAGRCNCRTMTNQMAEAVVGRSAALRVAAWQYASKIWRAMLDAYTSQSEAEREEAE